MFSIIEMNVLPEININYSFYGFYVCFLLSQLKFDLEVNKTTQALGNVDLVGRLNAPQVLADPDTHEYMWG